MKKTIGTTILATILTFGLFAIDGAVENTLTIAKSTETEISQKDENKGDDMKNEKKQNFFQKIGQFFNDAFSDMVKSAKAQHEVDKANFEAAKSEAKATFEENRFHNSFERAKEQGKQSWEDAKMSPAERSRKVQENRDAQLKAAQERKAAADERYEKAKKK